jgi:hypothetical protein
MVNKILKAENRPKIEFGTETTEKIKKSLKSKQLFQGGISSYFATFGNYYEKNFIDDFFWLFDVPKKRTAKYNSDEKRKEAKSFSLTYRKIQNSFKPAQQAASILFACQKLLYSSIANLSQKEKNEYIKNQKYAEGLGVNTELVYINETDHESLQNMNRVKKNLLQFTVFVLKPMVKFIQLMSYIDTAVLMLFVVFLLRKAINFLNELKEIYTLNVVKFEKHVSPYIVTYDPFIRNDLKMLKHFPKVNIKTVMVKLTNQQLQMLYKTMVGTMTSDDYYKLGMIESKSMIVKKHSMQELYETYGKMASNIGSVNNKFEQIIQMYKKFGKSTVVWSNFKKGIHNFAIYAAKHNLIAEHFDSSRKEEQLQKTIDNKIHFLLIPPHATEGLSLSGIEMMHILEPCESVAQYNQLKARIIRYVHNLKDKLTDQVYIINWVSIIPNKVTQNIAFYKLWKKSSLHQLPSLFKKKLTYKISPDAQQWKKINTLQKAYNNLYQKLSHTESTPNTKNDCTAYTWKNQKIQIPRANNCRQLYA